MIWLQRVGWGLLAAVTVAIAISVYVVRLPEPVNALRIDRATYSTDQQPASDLSLPHTVYPWIQNPDWIRYQMHIDLQAMRGAELFLFVPTVNRQAMLTLNGQPLFDSEMRALWAGPLVSSSIFVQLPHSLLQPGRNTLTITLKVGPYMVPTYLSRIYIGTEAVLGPSFKLWIFVGERLKTMALAAQVLLGFGVIFLYFYRPKDRLFGWLAAMVAASFILSFGMFLGFQPTVQNILPYIAALSPALGLLAVGVAFAVVGLPAPRALQAAIIIIPGVLMLMTATFPHLQILLALAEAGLLMIGFIAAATIIAWGALPRSGTEARLMLPPFFLAAWFLIRDAIFAFYIPERPLIPLTPYVRPLILAAVMAVLMRRLAITLDHLDRANENLSLKLAEQEAELAALHEEERMKAAQQVREQERQRLTHDLHDGISGHLVSIIAMSERAGTEVKPIEEAAREALGDLRLVIYSLDLGDRELPLALANFRERLVLQLRRTGVELDWSTASLPEVSGVTPGNALLVLRILQEAITNAVKHGPARRIKVHGHAAGDNAAAIVIENDGRPFAAGDTGFGLENMRRRAQQLDGSVLFEALDCGARVTLRFPRNLPDLHAASR